MSCGLTPDADFTREEDVPHQFIESSWFFSELDDATEVKLSDIVRRAGSYGRQAAWQTVLSAIRT